MFAFLKLNIGPFLCVFFEKKSFFLQREEEFSKTKQKEQLKNNIFQS